MDCAQVRRNYLVTWFVPDLVSAIPLDLLKVVLQSTFYTEFGFLRLFRVTKILRVAGNTYLAHYLTDLVHAGEDLFHIQVPEGLISMLRLMLGLIVLAHWVGRCFLSCSLNDFVNRQSAA